MGGVDSETAAVLLIVAVHLAVLPVLVWALLDSEGASWRGWWQGDEPPPGEPPSVPPAPRDGALPLPGADTPAIRLRTEHELLGGGREPARRHRHAPARERPRVPSAR